MAADLFAEVKKILDNAKSITENGAVGYQTTGKALLDMNYKVSSYRSRSESEILGDFIKALAEDPVLALKWAFYVGDIREGLGERRLFRILIKYILQSRKDLIKYVSEFNRFDSLFVLFDTDAESEMIDFIKNQLSADMKACASGQSVSLLAKWMPSINTSSEQTKALARRFIAAFGVNDKQYRKMLSKLRSKIDVTEIKMCSGDWDKIDYQKVPSKANLNYKDAFLRHDEARRREFLSKLERGEAKINSAVNFPHEILYKYRSQNWYNKDVVPELFKCYILKDVALEQMWKALPNTVGDKPVIVVRDGSCSMSSRVGKSNISAFDVATAFAIYFAERLPAGPYKDKFITFSMQPKFVNLGGLKDLKDKIQLAWSESECANTNVEGVFDLLLDAAKNGHIAQKDIPTVLILSDMEFDSCACSNSTIGNGWWTNTMIKSEQKTLFENIAAKWKRAGYVMPKCVFWNICGRTDTIPVKENEAGVALVSGFSVNTAKMVMSNKLDPYEILKETLNAPRYDVIK